MRQFRPTTAGESTHEKVSTTGETICALSPRNYAYEVLEVRFTLPDDTAAALGVDPEAVGETVRLAAAMKLYELGRLSTGGAAVLAGVAVPVLLSKLAEYHVDAFRLNADDVARDAQSA
jgi:predicted HTH domain antitoxin